LPPLPAFAAPARSIRGHKALLTRIGQNRAIFCPVPACSALAKPASLGYPALFHAHPPHFDLQESY
jgi:hypothetical protein